MDIDTYRRLRSEARRQARKSADADDLLQDALLFALEQGRDGDPAWLTGVIRNQAAMQARSATRRRRRETMAGADSEIALDDAQAHESASTTVTTAATVLGRLPPAARRVAVLALHGLSATEIRCVLGISETAFRQRLTTIRKVLAALAPAQRAEALALAYVRDPARTVDLQFGLVRRTLKAALRDTHGMNGADNAALGIGTHDADGHLLILRGRAHTSAPSGND